MKSLEDSLKEFRTAVAEHAACKRPAEYYASMATYCLKDAITKTGQHNRHPSEINKRASTRALYQTIKFLAKTSIVLDIDMPKPAYQNQDLSILYSNFWAGEHAPLLEYLMYSLETNMFFNIDWTLERLLRAATRTISKEDKE